MTDENTDTQNRSFDALALRARRACACALASVALTIAGATTANARQADAASVSGSFRLKGAISGRIAVSNNVCAASRSAPDVTFAWYGGVKGAKGITSNAIVSIEIDLERGPGYGHHGRFKKSANDRPPFVSFTSTNTDVIWQSVSGSYSTKSKGAAGSIDAVMHASQSSSGKLPGPVTIRGSWKGCPGAAGT